jgi:hypothetical protein
MSNTLECRHSVALSARIALRPGLLDWTARRAP